MNSKKYSRKRLILQEYINCRMFLKTVKIQCIILLVGEIRLPALKVEQSICFSKRTRQDLKTISSAFASAKVGRLCRHNPVSRWVHTIPMCSDWRWCYMSYETLLIIVNILFYSLIEVTIIAFAWIIEIVIILSKQKNTTYALASFVVFYYK